MRFKTSFLSFSIFLLALFLISHTIHAAEKKAEKSPAPKPNQAQEVPAQTLKSAQKPAAPVNVADVNRQLQDIIRMNDAMKANQASKIAEIQRIQEQARIHQQILKNLENSKAAAPVLNTGDVQEVLRQEKIRLIREQTARNSEIMRALDQRRS